MFVQYTSTRLSWYFIRYLLFLLQSKKELTFGDWVSCKKDQKEKEKEVEEQQRKEAQEAAVVHSRKECDKAFKECV